MSNNVPQCRCPHASTATGLVRSGWSSDCAIHRHQPATLTCFTVVSDGMGTRIPKYAEQQNVESLRELVMNMDKRLIECERQIKALGERLTFGETT